MQGGVAENRNDEMPFSFPVRASRRPATTWNEDEMRARGGGRGGGGGVSRVGVEMIHSDSHTEKQFYPLC